MCKNFGADLRKIHTKIMNLGSEFENFNWSGSENQAWVLSEDLDQIYRGFA